MSGKRAKRERREKMEEISEFTMLLDGDFTDDEVKSLVEDIFESEYQTESTEEDLQQYEIVRMEIGKDIDVGVEFSTSTGERKIKVFATDITWLKVLEEVVDSQPCMPGTLRKYLEDVADGIASTRVGVPVKFMGMCNNTTYEFELVDAIKPGVTSYLRFYNGDGVLTSSS